MGTVGQWYWHHFLKGVCFHLPLVGLLVALVALPFNVFGEEVGVVQLIWYENLYQRPLVGAALGMVALQALFVSYLLWDRARTEDRLDSDPGPLSFGRFVLFTLLCQFGTLVALGALWWLVGWLGEVRTAPDESPDPIANGDARPSWLKAAVPDPATPWGAAVWRVALLPLGALAVFGAVAAVSWWGAGDRLAALRLVERGRN
jgi:hypothetical protein